MSSFYIALYDISDSTTHHWAVVALKMLELEEFMNAQPVGQGSTPLIDVPWRRWECSQWAIRAIKSLVDASIMVLQSNRSFLTQAAASKAFWGPMLQVAGTQCAHEVLTRKAHNDSSSHTSTVEI